MAAKRYERGDRIPVRAQQIWLILTAHAVLKPQGKYEHGVGWSGWSPGLITYGDLAEQMGMDRRAAFTLGRHLGVVGYYCQSEDLPPLNVIAVNDEIGVPGRGVVMTEDIGTDMSNVLDFDWFSLRPPSVRVLRAIYEEHVALSR